MTSRFPTKSFSGGFVFVPVLFLILVLGGIYLFYTQLGKQQKPQSSSSITATPTLGPTTKSEDISDWNTHRDSVYGFSINIP